MKKAIVLILVMVLVFVGVYFIFSYDSEKINNTQSNTSNHQNIINEIYNSSIPNNNIVIPNAQSKEHEEIEIANFSTELQGDSARLNNIKVTCNTINGKTLNSGDTFSFNQIVGMPSKDKGYQEADVIVGTKVEKGYGGGNCQVSTTIYNACLQSPDIEIIEKNPHKKQVAYIEEGKDAAVSYSGNLDFKFKNNTGNQIKIYVNSENSKVTARIVKL